MVNLMININKFSQITTTTVPMYKFIKVYRLLIIKIKSTENF